MNTVKRHKVIKNSEQIFVDQTNNYTVRCSKPQHFHAEDALTTSDTRREFTFLQ